MVKKKLLILIILLIGGVFHNDIVCQYLDSQVFDRVLIDKDVKIKKSEIKKYKNKKSCYFSKENKNLIEKYGETAKVLLDFKLFLRAWTFDKSTDIYFELITNDKLNVIFKNLDSLRQVQLVNITVIPSQIYARRNLTDLRLYFSEINRELSDFKSVKNLLLITTIERLYTAFGINVLDDQIFASVKNLIPEVQNVQNIKLRKLLQKIIDLKSNGNLNMDMNLQLNIQDTIIPIHKYIDSSDYFVLDFWASYCAPCIKSFPTMDKKAKELNGKVKFVPIIMDSVDKGKKKWKKLRISNLDFVSIPDQELGLEKLRIRMYPTYHIFDKNGKHIAGPLHITNDVFLELNKRL